MKATNMNISGHMIIKNGIKFDYPFREACLSILPICSEFIFIEGNGDDGTYESLVELQKTHPRVKLFRENWHKEHYDILSEMTNKAIEQCSGTYHFQIQADECYHEKYLPKIQAACREGNFHYAGFGVYHFFSNFDTIYQPGVFYDEFTRLAKRSTYPRLRSYSDAMSIGCPDSDSAAFTYRNMMDVKAYHYGFVRKPKHLIEKQKQMTKWWGYQELDSYLQHGEENGKIDWLEKHSPSQLRQFPEEHPAVIRDWIAERSAMVREGIV